MLGQAFSTAPNRFLDPIQPTVSSDSTIITDLLSTLWPSLLCAPLFGRQHDPPFIPP